MLALALEIRERDARTTINSVIIINVGYMLGRFG